jgi:hypothetical protein
MRLSRIDQHIKDEPYAQQRALLGVFSSRFSSVSQGIRFAVSIFTVSPLNFIRLRVLNILPRTGREYPPPRPFVVYLAK